MLDDIVWATGKAIPNTTLVLNSRPVSSFARFPPGLVAELAADRETRGSHFHGPGGKKVSWIQEEAQMA